MARIDRGRLEAFAGGIVLDVPTRFGDLDIQGHVNNVAAVAILQEARSRFNLELGMGRLLGDCRALVAATTIEYAGELRHPGIVSVRTGILALGRSAITLGQIARQEGAPRLYAEGVMVVAREGGPVPMPDALRGAYVRHLIA